MGINFEIIESKGPIIEDPIRTLNQVENLKELKSNLKILQCKAEQSVI